MKKERKNGAKNTQMSDKAIFFSYNFGIGVTWYANAKLKKNHRVYKENANSNSQITFG